MNENIASTYSRFSRKTGALVAVTVGAVLAACSASNDEKSAHPPAASPTVVTAAVPGAKDPKLEAWHEVILKTSPPKNGCFQSAYPSTTWIEVPCGPPPIGSVSSPRRHEPKVTAKRAGVPSVGAGGGGTRGGNPAPPPPPVGNRNDFFAQVSGTMSMAIGSFLAVTTGLTENDPTGAGADSYSVQLNSNRFTNAQTQDACAGSATPSQCVGWQQAMYSSIEGRAGLYFQYWLLNYGSNDCPSGWTAANGGCRLNSDDVFGVPTNDVQNGSYPVPIAALGGMQMAMTAGSNDVLAMTIEKMSYAAVFYSVLGLDQGTSWNSAEFGVFGDLGSDEADFSTGTTIEVQIATVSAAVPASSVLSCTTADTAATGSEGATAETNNLNLVPNCCLVIEGATPSIKFLQGDVTGQSCTLCGGEGQPCCEPNDTTWCASSSDVCTVDGCQPCGGTGQACCASATCTTAGDSCQLDVCGPTNALAPIPSLISVAAGDGVWVSNTVSTNLDASGYWASNPSVPPSLSYCVLTTPGLPIPPCNTMPLGSGLSWAVPSGTNLVQITADAAAVQGTYTFAVTGEIGGVSEPAAPNLTLVVGACKPMTCATADTACGSIDNGCGETVACPGCPAGKNCIGGGCYACPEEYCAPPKFWNPSSCVCEGCACGTITVQGKPVCNVCRP
jgi:hypothetical protein